MIRKLLSVLLCLCLLTACGKSAGGTETAAADVTSSSESVQSAGSADGAENADDAEAEQVEQDTTESPAYTIDGRWVKYKESDDSTVYEGDEIEAAEMYDLKGGLGIYTVDIDGYKSELAVSADRTGENTYSLKFMGKLEIAEAVFDGDTMHYTTGSDLLGEYTTFYFAREQL